jgi:TPP-dependent pyruvate/acetoin dehydrogenase alpha subunit
LKPGDAVTATHRPHHVAIAQGVDLERMAAEIFGKATGLGKGKGGHMHLFSVEPNFGCSGIIGEGIPTACGAALAFKRRGLDNVAVAVFGEGAANQGSFHESLNLAGRWQLPVVFVCEDNTWAISVLKEVATAIPSNSDRAAAYGIPGVLVRENDPVAMYEAAGEAIARARAGGGATLIEVETDRLFGHFEGDPQVYRTEEQLEELRRRDALVRFAERLVSDGAASESELEEIRARVRAEVDAAVEFARSSSYPEPAEALADVFA